MWHYHPEYELTYIIHGNGKRLVGDSYENFQSGDLVLSGPSLPHTWVSDQKGKQSCRAIVIQFTTDFAAQLLSFTEMRDIRPLLEKAARGIPFDHKKNKECVLLLQQIISAGEVSQLSLLMQVLHLLSQKNGVMLASLQYRPMKGNENERRINKVLTYVQKEFKHEVSLKKAASIVHLSESAFCKFFKRASGKTFSDYTNEIRIAYACQLLTSSDQPINAIAFESGFESLTYFNRVFLKKKQLTPLAFRRQSGISA
jgi:AraC-like DNA-binding protein